MNSKTPPPQKKKKVSITCYKKMMVIGLQISCLHHEGPVAFQFNSVKLDINLRNQQIFYLVCAYLCKTDLHHISQYPTCNYYRLNTETIL